MQENNYPQYTNDLIKETSPYLLQHAHNPVNWKAWDKDVLKYAAQQNKLLLISIGYSACHWCHVMENESFTDKEVADLMNTHFVCIKVDREERPDVDQLYMEAVHIIKGQGGWPLNCFALSDGSAFWGGTYFTKENWIDVLNQIIYINEKSPQKLIEQADMIKKGISGNNVFFKTNLSEIKEINFDAVYNTISYQLDNVFGGTLNAPKFPMPSLYQFLLYYYSKTKNKELENHLILTFKSMADGGIFDHLAGGFSRYATDNKWNIPHFEKMLYDNAQLISLYSKAYVIFKNPFYKEIAIRIYAFVFNELLAENALFYCALDADSEGEEGKFYIWEKAEIEKELKEDANLFCSYYNVTTNGNWENSKNILFLNANSNSVFNDKSITEESLKHKIEICRNKLLEIRNKRIRPQTDNKILLSWNALMIESLLDLYIAFNDEKYLNQAQSKIDFILKNYIVDNKLIRLKDKSGKKIFAMLDDYAFLTQNLISLYQFTANEQYLSKAKQFIDFCLKHFYDKQSGLFYYTSDFEDTLYLRSKEVYDNVIPSSNSVIFKSIYLLSIIFEDAYYRDVYNKALNSIKETAVKYPASFSNWLKLLLEIKSGIIIVSITGSESKLYLKTIINQKTSAMLILVTEKESLLPYLKGKYVENKTMISVCSTDECYISTDNLEEAYVYIKEKVSI